MQIFGPFRFCESEWAIVGSWTLCIAAGYRDCMRLVNSKFHCQAATERVYGFCLRLQLELHLSKLSNYTSLFS